MREATPLPPPESLETDDIKHALHQLRSRMRRANDPDPMHLEFLEDDLREGKRTVESVQDFFEDVVTLLSSPGVRSADLVDLADDSAVLDQVDYLVVVINNLRRRLMQLALRSAR
jgi:hypothetical protein